jgi:hypothetical protein
MTYKKTQIYTNYKTFEYFITKKINFSVNILGQNTRGLSFRNHILYQQV